VEGVRGRLVGVILHEHPFHLVSQSRTAFRIARHRSSHLVTLMCPVPPSGTWHTQLPSYAPGLRRR